MTPHLSSRQHAMRSMTTALATALVLAAGLSTAQAATPAETTSQTASQTQPWLGLWQGQIGKSNVVVALSVNPESQHIEGRYFYERFGRDLSLWGPAINSPTASVMELQECPPDYGNALEVCDQPSAKITLRLPAAQGGKLEGTWQGHTLAGRRPPPPTLISLSRIGNYNPTAEAFKDPYEQRRLKGLKPKVAAGGQMGPVTWQTLTDARSGLAVPQFTKGAAAKVLDGINQQLKKAWVDRIGNALNAIDHEDEVNVVFANERWLATTYSVGAYYPGAAHPINDFSASTYDLHSGKAVDWAQWFRFTTPQSQSIDVNRRDLLAAQVLKALLTQMSSGNDGGGTLDDECAKAILEHYNCKGALCSNGELMGGRVPADWQIWPTPKGLAVSPDIYSEAERSCRGNEVLLPWKQVRAALLRPQDLP